MVKSLSDTKNSIIYNPEDRIKNADRLAKSLSSYLTNNSITKQKRGPPKDTRICQLNAAYKYIIHLEDNLKNICNKNKQELPDDCNLVHNAYIQTNNMSFRRRLENSDMTPTTPTQRNDLIHESSTLSGSISASSPTTILDSNKPNCSTSKPSSKTLRNFDIDASPILGSENHFYNEIDNFSEFENKLGKTNCSQAMNFNLNTSRKRKLNTGSNNNNIEINNNNSNCVDLNNNSEKEKKIRGNKRSALNTPKMSNIITNTIDFQTPDNLNQNLIQHNQDTITRNHYFLRSTNRLKNMLIASNVVTKTPPSSNLKNDNTKQIKNKKNPYSKFLDMSQSSSKSSSSMTTTPSVPNSNISSNVSNEFDGLESKNQNIIKTNLSQEQQILKLHNKSNHQNESSKSNHQNKENFPFV